MSTEQILRSLNESIDYPTDSAINMTAPADQRGIEWMKHSSRRTRFIERLAEQFDKAEQHGAKYEPLAVEFSDGTAIVLPTTAEKLNKTFTEQKITDHHDMINKEMMISERLAGNYGLFKEFDLKHSPNKGRSIINLKTDADTIISIEIDSVTLTDTHIARVLTTLASI